MSEQLLDRVLEWVNARRSEIGREPLNELPVGAPRDPYRCVVAQALGTRCNTLDYSENYDKLPEFVTVFIRAFDARMFPGLIDWDVV